ncbi:MAG TPA: alpha/beta hydrolase [Dehalococcoidales bacterium]|nr:alpha/beta hydrolase [Dehalococcoidales bacterium]
MPTANINGFEMYYETKGDGFPLVYVHGGFGGLGTGMGAEAPAWRDRFARYFRVITYDRRASGRSGYPEEGFTMKDFAGDILELLHYLGHDRAHILGTSAGGQITLAFGLEFPEATASLVVTDSAPWLSPDEEMKARLRERIRILNEDSPLAAYEARTTEGTVGLNLFVGRPERTEKESHAQQEAMERIREMLRQTPREERIAKYAGELRTYSGYVDWDATPQFRDIKPPTLVLYGTEDSVFPAQGSRDMARLIPDVQVKAFEGAEHGVTRFPEALDIIFSFLQQHTPGSV